MRNASWVIFATYNVPAETKFAYDDLKHDLFARVRQVPYQKITVVLPWYTMVILWYIMVFPGSTTVFYFTIMLYHGRIKFLSWYYHGIHYTTMEYHGNTVVYNITTIL